MKIHFLLPAYNEEANIERLIGRLSEMASRSGHEHAICVIDDGSTDSTADIVDKISRADSRVALTRHTENGGPGKAFMTGFQVIFQSASDDDVIISMDADNTHSEQTIHFMLARLNEGFEMVIASVFARGGMLIGLPFLRYVLTLSCNFIYRILFPVSGIREYTGFYRAYRVGSLRRAFSKYQESGEPILSASGFATAAELLIKLRRIPVFMTEVPMLVRYDQKGSKSKLRIVRTIAEHLRIIAANLLKRNIV